jgi:hypothetical protein
VVTGTSSSHSQGSHIIPQSLIRVDPSTFCANFLQLKVKLHGVFKLGQVYIRDPDNPRVGILLEPGLNHHFDRYELSIYTGVQLSLKCSNLQNTNGVVHLFRTERSQEECDWVPSAREYEGEPVNIRWNDDVIEIVDHHYKHSLIYAWGSDELKRRLSDFPEADVDAMNGGAGTRIRI